MNYNLHTDDDWKDNSGNGNGNNKDNSGSGNNGNGNSGNNGNGNGNGKGKGNNKKNSKSGGTDDAGYGNATNAEENNSQNQCGILFPLQEEVSATEADLIARIKTTGKEKNYELIEYLNDVNREHAEVLVEQNINGKTDTSYIYGAEINGGFDRISLDRFDGSTGYYLYDARGSVSGITNEEGQVYQSYRYSVTGEITFGAPQYENEYTYNGESYNPNIESQYLRARYYCVVTATFLTEDSYLGSLTEPLTLNRYNYCVSSYLNYTDPSGNWLYEDEINELHVKYNLLEGNYKMKNATPTYTQVRTFLSAMREVGREDVDVDYVLSYNYQLGRTYVKNVEKVAKKRNNIYECEVRERLYNFMDLTLSNRGYIALMYWETVNKYSLEKGYLQFEERTAKGNRILNIGNLSYLQQAIKIANNNGNEISLIGVKPHYVGDGSTTVGFGDYLTVDDIAYYESKGYKLNVLGKQVSFANQVDYIPIDIIVEKYLADVTKVDENLKHNINADLDGNILYCNQRTFDALVIAKYQTGTLGANIQKLIIEQEKNPEIWKNELMKIGVEEKRALWEVDTIMFGNGNYFGDDDITPLYGISIEGITK